MPKSKRQKLVSLTRTDKKGHQMKEKLINEIRDCVNDYESIYLFIVENMRNAKLKDVRKEWRDSRMFLGRNKVIALALGKTPETECKPGVHEIAQHVSGNIGVFFTNSDAAEIKRWFDDFREADFARSGDEAKETISLKEGPLAQFSHAIEPHLRKLGLPTTLKRGVVTMLKDHTVCTKGEILKPEQANLLKLLEIKMATFSIRLTHKYSEADGCLELE
eukprot:m.339001 g.339001  ORF g.339001 m.339001 type:complete len:219 (+) comp18628_c0_seq1:164-820(+)